MAETELVEQLREQPDDYEYRLVIHHGWVVVRKSDIYKYITRFSHRSIQIMYVVSHEASIVWVHVYPTETGGEGK